MQQGMSYHHVRLAIDWTRCSLTQRGCPLSVWRSAWQHQPLIGFSLQRMTTAVNTLFSTDSLTHPQDIERDTFD